MKNPTPLLCLETVAPGLWGKIEYIHPSGSMKHRALPSFIEELARSGELRPGQTLAVRSAGSAAVTAAWAGSRLGLHVIAVLPPFASDHTVRALSWLGAAVHRVPPQRGTELMNELAAEPDIYVLAQAAEERLIDRYRPVAGEILDALPGVSALVAGIGTGLSITGIAREMRAREAPCAVYGTEPAEAQVAAGQPWSPHRIPGLAPPIAQPLLDKSLLAGIVPVPSERAWAVARRVARSEGLLVGPSSGATIAAALTLREQGIDGPIVAICACGMSEYYEMTLGARIPPSAALRNN